MPHPELTLERRIDAELCGLDAKMCVYADDLHGHVVGAESKIWRVQCGQNAVKQHRDHNAAGQQPGKLAQVQLLDGNSIAALGRVPQPGDGGPYRHGQRHAQIGDHLTPVAEPEGDDTV